MFALASPVGATFASETVSAPLVVPEFEEPGEEIVWLLRALRLPEPPPAPDLQTALVARGERIVEPLLDVLASERVPALGEADPQILSVYQRALALDSLAALESPLPSRAARRWLSDEWSPDQRAAGLRILGATGRATDVRALLSGAAPPAEGDAPPRRVSDALEAGLAELLAREPEAWQGLAEYWWDSSDAVLVPVTRAVGATADPRGVAFLGEVLIWRPALALHIATELRALGTCPDSEVAENLAVRLEALLDPEKPRLCNAAVLALGSLGSFRPTAQLVELLEPELGVQGNAHWALQELTGLKLPPDQGVWSFWLETERTWFEEKFRRVELLLARGDASVVAAALREAAAHRYERHAVARAIAQVLSNPRAELRVQACDVLGALGSTRITGALVDALDDRSPEVVRAAHAALQQVTGLSLAADPELWRVAL